MSDTNTPNNNNMPEDNDMPENNNEKFETVEQFLKRFEGKQAGNKVDNYARAHFAHDFGTDEYERYDLIQTVVDYLISDIECMVGTRDALLFKHNIENLTARGMAVTKFEDLFVALYRLLDTCSDDHLLAFLPKDNHNYNPESCGGFRE